MGLHSQTSRYLKISKTHAHLRWVKEREDTHCQFFQCRPVVFHTTMIVWKWRASATRAGSVHQNQTPNLKGCAIRRGVSALAFGSPVFVAGMSLFDTSLVVFARWEALA